MLRGNKKRLVHSVDIVYIVCVLIFQTIDF
jgi:hypothetical protein